MLSAGIEPTHMASEANALSTELGELIMYNENLRPGICQGFIDRGILFYRKSNPDTIFNKLLKRSLLSDHGCITIILDVFISSKVGENVRFPKLSFKTDPEKLHGRSFSGTW